MHRRTQIYGFLTVLIILGLTSITYNAATNSGGAPASRTNAPGETNCTSCHSSSWGLQTSGSIHDAITFDANFHGGGYLPDSTYNFTVKMVRDGISKWGFQVTCLDASNDMAGTLNVGPSGTRKVTGVVSGGTRQYITHSSGGTSGTDSVSWQFSWKAPSSNLDTLNLYTVLNAADNSFGTTGDSIVAKLFRIAPSSWIPSAEIDADTNVICSGETVQFYALSSDTNATYSWTFPTGIPGVSTAKNPVVRFNSSGVRTVTMTATNSYGTSAAATYDLRIKQTPTAQILTTDQEICQGDSVELRASFDPTYSYLWSDGQTGNAIYVKDTGTYSVTVTKSGCTKTSNTVRVNYLPRPTAQLTISGTTSDTACVGSQIELTAATGPDSFYFYRGDDLLAASDTNAWTTTLDSTASYSLVVRSDQGCLSEPDSKMVYERDRMPAPQVDCEAEGVTAVRFSWDTTTYTNGMEVSLDNAQWTSPSGSGQHRISGLQPDQEQMLYLRAVDGGICDFSEVRTAVCATDTCRVPDLTLDYTDRVCEGEEVRVEVSGLPSSFSMRIEDGNRTADSVIQFIPGSTGDYALKVLDSTQEVCGETEHFLTIQVDERPSIELTSNGNDFAFCAGDSAVISVNDNFDRVTFLYNAQIVQDGSSNTYGRSALENGDSLKVRTYSGACADSSEVQYLTVNPLPSAGFSFVRNGSEYTFTADEQGLSSYEWDFGDGATSDQTNPVHDYEQQQNQTVQVRLQVTDENGCVQDTTISVEIPDLSSIGDLAQGGITIYPNPVENELVISNQGEPGAYRISDLQGRVMLEGELKGHELKLDLHALESGLYVLEVKRGTKRFSGRFVKH